MKETEKHLERIAFELSKMNKKMEVLVDSLTKAKDKLINSKEINPSIGSTGPMDGQGIPHSEK